VKRDLALTLTALALGVLGYLFQGNPRLSGAPNPAQVMVTSDPAEWIALRETMSGDAVPTQNHWVIIADGFVRHGQFADAIGILRGAVEQNPHSAEAWLALGNALTGHAGDKPTPAALYAWKRAAQANPQLPGPAFFLGLTLARSGREAQARTLWDALLQQAPVDAPWRTELERQIATLSQPGTAR
jgi:cytochrome c-type biogenesis protein CcmH